VSILNQKKLVKFDINNKKHLEEAKHFFDNSRWKTSCPFEVEADYISIPHMIADKLAVAFLNNKLKVK